MTSSLGWMRAYLPSALGGSSAADVEGPHEEAAAATGGGVTIAEGWHDTTARTLSAMLTARDTAAAAFDASLKRAGLREEDRSALRWARDNLEGATARMWDALGYHYEPRA